MPPRRIPPTARLHANESADETAAAAAGATKKHPAKPGAGAAHSIADAGVQDKAERALEVVKELHKRYQAQDERWHNYSKLIGFILFTALMLAVLYMQRDAHILYQVHSTIAASVLPDPEDITSPADVLSWLQTFLKKTWVDPACGDGLCESPFEFASYGRFGCRADCGRLSEAVENLTVIQIDLTYSFNHPAGSIAATELMSQATWNLCPEHGAPHGRDCYYEDDQAFDRLTGTAQQVIDDVPDGLWTIKVKRDFMQKVKGAVRIRDLVEQQARQYTKIYVALESAKANHDYELTVLSDAIALAREPLATLMQDTIRSEVETEIANLQTQLQAGTITEAQHDAAKADLEAYRDNMVENINRRGGCPSLGAFNYGGYPSGSGAVIPADTVWASNIGNGAAITTVTLTPPAGSSLTYDSLLPSGTSVCNPTCVCTKLVDVASATRQSRHDTIQTGLIARLDQTNGRLGAQRDKKLELMQAVVSDTPELYDFIIDLSTGLDPLNDPQEAQLDNLIDVYVDGPLAFGVDGQPNVADSLLKRTPILEFNITSDSDATGKLIERVQARQTEIAAIQSEVAQLPAVTAVNAQLATFQTIKAVNYTVAYWDGGEERFNYCNLEVRGPLYEGVCTPSIPYTLTSVESAPYACGSYPNGTTLAAGVQCTQQVDRQLDCAAFCECTAETYLGVITRGCSSGSYCTCPACETLANARDDPEFISIEETMNAAASPTGRRLQEMVEEQHLARKAVTRRLTQITESTVTSLLSGVNALKDSQDALKARVTTLSTQVQEANAAAEARAQDRTLENLINAGRQDILLGQARVENLLAQIIGKQNQALAAAEQAQAVSQAISLLQEKATEATASVIHAVEEQISAIKQAGQQGLISVDQALVLWKRARRDREVAMKEAILANSACTTERVETHDFEVDNYQDDVPDTARERLIGLTNRIIAGMLVHTTRTRYEDCQDSRFSKIENQCAGGISTQAFGVDPVFVTGSSLFDPDLDNQNALLGIYNCSGVPADEQRYDQPDPYVEGQVTNQSPFCANLFNMRNVPFGFFHYPLDGKQDGFPVWFDINLSEHQAQYWYQYIKEGLMLDVLTREVTVELVTYNAELRMFSSVFVRFRFTDGGAIAVSYRLHTIGVELYSTPSDYTRLVLEIVFALCVFVTAVYQLKGMYTAWVETHNPLSYFTSGWTWVGLSSTAIMITSNIVWWTFVLRYIPQFDIDIRYNVYEDLNAQAHILRLHGDGSQLGSAYAAFSKLQFLVQTLSWYYALNGINILLVIARMLNLMHFQPRLGVVTRSLLLAGPDLMHFTVVAGIVFVGYAMMAHVIFGNVIKKFSTFRLAIDTCFEMLLGEIGVNEELKALSGLQGLAGSLFFWTFELLVFMVLLNFLLAIIVDAFSVVKDHTSESTGLHEELGQMMREQWRALLGRMLNVHYIPSHRLSALLKHWAGSDQNEKKQTEEEDDKAKRVRVLDHMLEEDQLIEVFREAMSNMVELPGEDEHDEEKGTKGLKARCFPKKAAVKANDGKLTPEELEAAAKWILERFGQTEEEEEEEEEDTLEDSKYSEEALEKERNALAQALERLAVVQRELAIGQHELMVGQKALAEQQDKLVQFLESPFDDDDDDDEDGDGDAVSPASGRAEASSSQAAFSPGASGGIPAMKSVQIADVDDHATESRPPRPGGPAVSKVVSFKPLAGDDSDDDD